jgi:ribonucleotide monophosphatase NagD (HAD superfamily)
MVGDDIEADIKGAQDAGLKAALVKTGKFQAEDLKRGIVPDAVLETVSDLPTLLT